MYLLTGACVSLVCVYGFLMMIFRAGIYRANFVIAVRICSVLVSGENELDNDVGRRTVRACVRNVCIVARACSNPRDGQRCATQPEQETDWIH